VCNMVSETGGNFCKGDKKENIRLGVPYTAGTDGVHSKFHVHGSMHG
jgi:hypothetical protein